MEVAPGVGSRFIQQFFVAAAHRIERIDTSRKKASFKFDGALRKFDKSDRKFVYVAAECGFTIVNATDSDWVEHKEALERRGLKIDFLCGLNVHTWFEPKK